MANIITIENRTISGVGLLRIPETELNYRQYSLFAQIIRKPTNEYLSFEHSPPQGFYARITFLKSGSVITRHDMRYPKEKLIFVPDPPNQNLIAIQCSYQGVLESFVNLGTQLGLILPTLVNEIEDWKALPLPWDEIQVACYSDTAIAFTLKAIEYDVCNEDYPEPQEEPEPPEEETPIPPGTPIEISPPYEDDEITNKAPIDEEFIPPEDLPTGIACDRYQVDFTWTEAGTGTARNRTWYIRGQYIPSSISVTNNTISGATFVMQAQASSQNIAGINASTCGLLREVSLGSVTPGFPTDIRNVVFTPL